MRTTITTLALCLLACLPSFAQDRTRIGLELMSYLERQHGPDAQVDLFIHGDAGQLAPAVRAHGGLVKQAIKGVLNVRLPIGAVVPLSEHPAVEVFEFSLAPPHLANDSALLKSGVDKVHAGMAPLMEPYTGKDVVIGIIDTGIDPLHPDFLRANGETRVLKYWDQGLAPGPLTPTPYGYGQVWSSEHIENGQFTSVDQSGHGSAVAGIAAGNGSANGMHKGVAPEADLMIVQYVGGANFTSNVADAVHFIFTEAAAIGKPCVVNISLGRRLGSHDAKDGAAMIIDAMIDEQPGRVVVCAAGNWNEWDPYHLRTNVTADTSFTWFAYNPDMNFGGGVTGGVYFEAWADAADLQNVQYAIGADRVTPGYQFRGRTPFHNVSENLGVLIVDTLFSPSGNRIGIVQFLAQPRGEQYQLMVMVVQPDSSAYNFRFMTTGSGKFDVWSLRYDGWSQMLPYNWPTVVTVPTAAQYPPMAHYVFPDNNKHITDSWTCSPKVITVANYRNEISYTAFDGSFQTAPNIVEGEITSTSSKGPTRDDRLKPEIAAPGDVTFAPIPLALITWFQQNEPFKLAQGGMHMRMGGTSAASPHVAGIAALYLEKCPMATSQEVREALFTTAYTDALTGEVPNVQWGHGKVDGFASVISSNVDPFAIAVVGDLPFCEGQEVTLQAPSDLLDHVWSNGSEGASTIQFGEEGPISVIGHNTSYCKVYSDTLTFAMLEAPPVPVIMVDGTLLTSSEAEAYQWYVDGEAIDGADGQVHEAMMNGSYHVVVTAGNGCSSESDPVMVISTSTVGITGNAVLVWPSPAREMVHIRKDRGGNTWIRMYDEGGRKVLEKQVDAEGVISLPLMEHAPGVYIMEVQDDRVTTLHRFVKLP